MPAMDSKENLSMLLKEALLLSKQIAAMDERVDETLRSRNGKFASLIHDFEEGHPIVVAGAEKGTDWAKGHYIDDRIQAELIQILARVAKISIPSLEKGAKIGGWVWSVFAQILEPVNKGAEWQKEVYFDDHVQTAREYDAKVKRLAEITKMFVVSVPSQSWDLSNTCQIQQCYKSMPSR